MNVRKKLVECLPITDRCKIFYKLSLEFMTVGNPAFSQEHYAEGTPHIRWHLTVGILLNASSVSLSFDVGDFKVVIFE